MKYLRKYRDEPLEETAAERVARDLEMMGLKMPSAPFELTLTIGQEVPLHYYAKAYYEKT